MRVTVPILSPADERVFALLGRWRTARSVARRTGLKMESASVVLRRLRRLGVVERRQAANFRLRGSLTRYRSKLSRKALRLRRERKAKALIAGVEPLDAKLCRLLGLRRARDAQKFFNGDQHVTSESNQQ